MEKEERESVGKRGIDNPYYRVLLIDERAEDREVVSIYLKDDSIRISEADTPDKGVEMIKEQIIAGDPYHIIFIDYGIFLHNSIETAGSIRKISKDAILISMMTFYLKHAIKPIHKSGYFDFILDKMSSRKRYQWFMTCAKQRVEEQHKKKLEMERAARRDNKDTGYLVENKNGEKNTLPGNEINTTHESIITDIEKPETVNNKLKDAKTSESEILNIFPIDGNN